MSWIAKWRLKRIHKLYGKVLKLEKKLDGTEQVHEAVRLRFLWMNSTARLADKVMRDKGMSRGQRRAWFRNQISLATKPIEEGQ